MENSFTEKLRKLREKLDDTSEARHDFMGNLHKNVHEMRAGAQRFMAQLREGHMDMAQRTQDKLGDFRKQRSAFSADLKAGAHFLRNQGSSRSDRAH